MLQMTIKAVIVVLAVAVVVIIIFFSTKWKKKCGIALLLHVYKVKMTYINLRLTRGNNRFKTIMPFIQNIENFQTGWDQVSSSWIDLDWFDDNSFMCHSSVLHFVVIGTWLDGWMVESLFFLKLLILTLFFSFCNFSHHHHHK